MRQKRIFTIDIARAISIIFVVTGHFDLDYNPLWWQSFYWILHTFRMPLFLALSGYTYMYLLKEREDKRRTYGNFVLNKFQRLMVPYFFISVLIISLKMFTGVVTTVSLTPFFEMIYRPAAAQFLWFVYVLFMIFLIVPFFNSRNKLIALFAIALVLHLLHLDLMATATFVHYFLRMLVFFVIGCLFYELSHVRKIIMNVHFLVFAALFALFYWTPIESIKVLRDFLASLCGVVMIIKIAKFISEKGKTQQVFLSVAACSYTIYLFHTTFMGFAKTLFSKIPLQHYLGDDLTFIVVGLITISIGVSAPILLHHIVVRKSKILSYLIGARFMKKNPPK